jgi:opacity protein-like surface antigen
MKTLLATCLFALVLTAASQAADPALAGTWFGSIDTDRGQMEIGLTLTAQNDRLTGVIKTAHGDWEVTAVAEKGGQWTVSFKGGGNEGQMIGRIKDTTFAGEWKSKMANGRFEVVRSKKK